MFYFTLLSSCARNCKYQSELFLKLGTVGNEYLYELGERTRSFLGFYFWIDKNSSWSEDNETDEWNTYILSFDLLWFQVVFEMYGRSLLKAAWRHITWKEEEPEDRNFDPHLGCQNWPVCDTEGCGGGK
tara:strand:- start:136 stop:522 length:387 start_codon:yes stop_codon:yes gene_type:complete